MRNITMAYTIAGLGGVGALAAALLWRHANATKVRIEFLAEEFKVRVAITDNGKGFADDRLSNPQSFGLLSMRERISTLGGTLTIQSMLGKGTTLEAVIPIEKS